MNTSKIRLMGYLTDVEAQYTPNGTYFVKTSLPINKGKGDDQETNWYNLTVWGKSGELFNRLCQKKTRVLIEGELWVREWTSKEGKKGFSLDVTVREFTVLANGKPFENNDESQVEDEPEFMKD